MLESASAIIFTALTGIVIFFQASLAAGVPWGAASMGGKYPGKYPSHMRIVAAISILILALIAALVLSEANLLFPQLRSISRIGIWVILYFSLPGQL
ncbi:hypothetical protein GCM10007103_14430 [Salinimicrobium marinum]|uniref:Uncharacterized protein n=1 Tax=Salinimicrobium marinum TaxID=680283 RepID=A0A918SCC1_9FLAO|nr:hypothetical protein [Salinimicrobium marinum]GHA33990.1 hypothetical protein GCM10007103_14430 [Salinimicrobium marinum]